MGGLCRKLESNCSIDGRVTFNSHYLPVISFISGMKYLCQVVRYTLPITIYGYDFNMTAISHKAISGVLKHATVYLNKYFSDVPVSKIYDLQQKLGSNPFSG